MCSLSGLIGNWKAGIGSIQDDIKNILPDDHGFLIYSNVVGWLKTSQARIDKFSVLAITHDAQHRPLVIGFGFVSEHGVSDPYYIIGGYAVHPDYKMKGIGRSIIKAIMERMVVGGVYCLRAEVHDENIASLRALQRALC